MSLLIFILFCSFNVRRRIDRTGVEPVGSVPQPACQPLLCKKGLKMCKEVVGSLYIIYYSIFELK
nr:MAG TPA: hypothetical protein [Caudoviricetes sp.]